MNDVCICSIRRSSLLANKADVSLLSCTRDIFSLALICVLIRKDKSLERFPRPSPFSQHVFANATERIEVEPDRQKQINAEKNMSLTNSKQPADGDHIVYFTKLQPVVVFFSIFLVCFAGLLYFSLSRDEERSLHQRILSSTRQNKARTNVQRVLKE